ncbi:electron transfer flavoprotein subunit alpha/FixB family protein [Lacihabitans soyangensis]|uniref:Electron transfer flavoprotein subunit alpha/FixB family protein n=1 Tax=Lacihabitans soyangensis TaxID=869394 RepID=A0AAE3H2V3_9BACT|nr:electron transfer flavoprotein subunit alpha/FixB family protein [Lacihabitans soyangensis]MCP9763888.1 electron transfer flavoprotein subunit alpha/FixB family protein [Lacihabitans soyangensis]
MSVLVYTELADGQFKKSSLEAIFYGSKVAAQVGGSMTVLAIGSASDDELSKAGYFGATKVLHANAQNLASENIMAYSKVLSETAKSVSAKVVISAKSSLADAVMARAVGALKAGLVGNVVELPDTSNGFKVKRSIFTGKAFAETSITSDVKFIAIKKNVLPLEETSNSATVEKLSVDTGSLTESSKVLETIKATGTVSLPEADLVVSGGRGMKGPEHWQPLLDLAEALGAATACSKPVSDLDWRPHHEHVGQTGVKVAPNLYIACGISGAIQHLAGVNSSKVIVVINKDPEAPFFKAADYGIVGDVFDVLPKLTAAVKAL